MAKDKHTDKNPKLDILVNRYQKTKAPLGFADRVSAHIEDERTQQQPVFSWEGNVTSLVSPKLLYVASFGFIVLVSVLIVPSITEIEPELQVAKQDKPKQLSTSKDEDAQDSGSQNEKLQVAFRR